MFEYELELLQPLAGGAALAVDPSVLLGDKMTVRVDRPDGQPRFFNGYVRRFERLGARDGFMVYRAVLVPWLWFLTQSSDCEIFQNMSVIDIIKQVCGDLGFDDIQDSGLAGNYQPVEYCVQYRETDFNFVSRLMEREGIYYFFEHDEQKHTMVLAEDISAHNPVPGYETIRYRDRSMRSGPVGESIYDWIVADELRSNTCALNDFDFTKPTSPLAVVSQAEHPDTAPGLEVYDYPGGYTTVDAGTRYARINIESIRSDTQVARATTNAYGVACGATFELTDHDNAPYCHEYLVTGVQYHFISPEYTTGGGGGGMSDGETSQCRFTAIDTTLPFRPKRVTPQPIIQGPQTAITVGPSGQEIWPDKYGRVKVHFHWDRYDNSDESSSCWIRVSQVHAGKGFGSIDLPRIGEEVIIEHLEGDPDRPIITGRVYNGKNMPPTNLPGEGVVSGMKSNTVKGRGFNGMTMNDTAGAEAVSIHGQHNMDTTVENDQTNTVNNNQTNTIASNQTNTINSNRDTSVAADDSESVGANKKMDIGSNLDSMIGSNLSSMIGGRQTETVAGTSMINVAGKRMESVGGGHMFTNPKMLMNVGGKYMVNAGSSIKQSSPKVDLKAGSKMSATSGGPVKVKAGGPIKQQSGGAFSIKSGGAIKEQAGGAFKIKAGGALKQQGANITLKGPTKVAGKTKITKKLKVKGSTLTVS